MAQNSAFMIRLLASSVTTAARAGTIIRDVMKKGDLGIVNKNETLIKRIASHVTTQSWYQLLRITGSGKNDLQTEADRSAQECIIGSLSKLFPDVTIIGEEGPAPPVDQVRSDWIITDLDNDILSMECPNEYLQVDPKDIVVWVDPLDGTSEYTEGLFDSVTVLIGFAHKGEVIGGVIHQPYYNYLADKNTTGRTLWGLIGLGVGGFVAKDPPSDKLIVTSTRSHSDGIVKQALQALQPDEIIRVGGAGRKAISLFEGEAHAYVHASKGCKKWDTCAPEGILRALGGTLTDVRGKKYNYGKDVAFPNAQGIFATAKNVDHKALLAKLPQDVLDVFPY